MTYYLFTHTRTRTITEVGQVILELKNIDEAFKRSSYEVKPVHWAEESEIIEGGRITFDGSKRKINDDERWLLRPAPTKEQTA
jgi:hypothetical protein